MRDAAKGARGVGLLVCVTLLVTISDGSASEPIPAHRSDDPPRVVADRQAQEWSAGDGSEQAQGEEVVISVERLTDHVALARVGDQPEFGSIILNNVLAIGSAAGVTVVDTGYYPQSAHRLRELLARELANDTFEYVVNTHWHWDHHNGNLAFADAIIVAHHGIVSALERFEADLASFLEQRQERLEAWSQTLAAESLTPAEALEARGWAFAHARFLSEFEIGYEVVFPDITFTEKMTLHSGDLRIELVAVPAFHSDHDVLVVVPGNEVVAIGDVFFPGALPSISTEHAPHLSEFVREMSEFLALYPSVTTFVPGHGRLMSRLEIELIVRYLDQLDQGVSEAQAAGHSLDQTRRLLPLSELFADLELLGNSASATHEANLDVLWRSR